MLKVVRDLAPAVFLMVHSAYSAPYFLYSWGPPHHSWSYIRMYSKVTPGTLCFSFTYTSPLHQSEVSVLYNVLSSCDNWMWHREQFAWFESHQENPGPCTIAIILSRGGRWGCHNEIFLHFLAVICGESSMWFSDHWARAKGGGGGTDKEWG